MLARWSICLVAATVIGFDGLMLRAEEVAPQGRPGVVRRAPRFTSCVL